MHPFVTGAIITEIQNDRRQTARHARSVRRRHRRAVVRRVLSTR